MKTHSNNFKNELTKFGREFADIITYNGITLSMEDVKSVNYSIKSSLMKSIMKQLTIDTTREMTRGDVIGYKLGLNINGTYEYLDYGNYIVEKIEKQENKKSWLVTCYDKMLITMVDYVDMQLNYPITIREYIQAICNHFDITFANANSTFINYNKTINNELYLDETGKSLGYTFRDVLDELAQVTGSFIIINNNDELELKYIENTANLELFGNTLQNGTPTPESPQEIEVVTGRNEIDIVGKNLLEVKRESYTSNGITTTYNSNTGLLHSSGTTTTSWPWIVDTTLTAPIPSGTTLTFSTRNALDYGVSLRLYYTNNDREVMSINAGSFSNKITVTHDIIKIAILLNRGANVEVNEDFYLQLEKGNTKTDFEPYRRQSYELNLGKNLFNKDNANIINGYISGSAKITSGSSDKIIYISCKPNTTYTIQKMLPRTTSKNRFRVGTSETIPVVNMTLNQYYNGGDGSTVTQYTITTNSTANYLVFFCYTNDTETTFDEIEASIQIEKGNQASSYSPYFTPIELCKIGNYEDSFYYQNESKNLFDKDNANIINASINTDRAIATSSNAKSLYISCLPNTTYSISKLGERFRVGTTTDIPIVGATCIDYVADDTATSLTITTSSNANYLLVYYFLNNTDTLTEEQILDSIQIEKGQATEYQPYGSGCFIKKNIGKVVLTGNDITAININQTNTTRAKTDQHFINALTSEEFYNNYFPNISNWGTDVVGLYFSYINGDIWFRAEKSLIGTTLDSVKSWVNSNNIIVYYVLATPTYTKIDGELLNQIRDINNAHPYNETNIIQISNNLPFELNTNKFLNEYIDENYFNNINVNIGKKYGPINSLVFSRSADSDIITRTDDESISLNGLCEIKISDNQILNDNNRSDYIEELFNYLNGISYYLNDYDLKGVLYYEIGDLYNVSIFENMYQCLLLNDEINRKPGVSETIYTEEPEISVSDYNASSQTDKAINKAYLIVNKQEGRIESLVSKTNTIDVTVNNNYQELNGKFNDYTPVSRTIEIENSVSTLQTDTYTKTEINTKLTDGSVTKVMTTSGTFDENGMHYEKTNAPTSTTINEVGVGVKKTSDTDYVLFAGYVDDNNTQYSDFKGQTIVASENMLVKNYMVVGSKSRFEDYEDGTGCFYIGG